MLGGSGFEHPRCQSQRPIGQLLSELPAVISVPGCEAALVCPGGLPYPSVGPSKDEAGALCLGNISPPTAGVEI